MTAGAIAEPYMLDEPIREGKSELVKLLLKSTNNINERLHRTDETLLHLAVSENKLEIVKLLVANGANINAAGERRRTPLFIAFENDIYQYNSNDTIRKSSPMVDYLVAHDANVNGTDSSLRSDLLLRAAEDHQLTAVRYLLQAGTNPNIKRGNQAENTPLQFAILNGDAAIVRTLIKAGADINEPSYDDLPIIIAIKKGYYQS